MTNPYKHVGSESPYYDDFDVSKNYVRIMYNPSKGVQARELTQSQTLLQNQLASLGGYVFKDGSVVKGARISTSYNQPALQVKLINADGATITPANLVGKVYIGSTSNQPIIVTGLSNESRYILFSYMGSEIVDGETFVDQADPSMNFIMESGTLSNAFVAASGEGILFIDGYFCFVEPQNISIGVNVLDSDTYHIGYMIERKYVTSETDSSLNDPAAGSYNYNAPGADRYQINVELFGYKDGDAEITPEMLSNYLPQIIITGDKLSLEQSSDPNSDLMDTLAQRTFEESGSYAVNPWKIYLREHDSDLSKFVAEVQPGLGYIQGYRVNNIASKEIEINKPRTFLNKAHISSYIPDAAYTLALIDDVTGGISGKGIPDYQKQEIVEVMTGVDGTGSVLGECRIINIYKSGNSVFVYLRNTSAIQNAFSGAKSIRSKANPSLLYINLFLGTVGSATFVAGSSVPIINSTYSKVKEIVSGEIEYESTRSYVATSEVSGNTINLTESDTTIDFPTFVGLVSVYNTSTGVHLNINNLSLTPNNSGSVSIATITGAAIENATSYTVVLRIQRDLMGIRTKVAANGTTSATIGSTVDFITLNQEDIIDIISVVQTSNTTVNTPADLKDELVFFNGQTDFTYGAGVVSGFSTLPSTYKNTPLGNTAYTITFRYYNHIGQGPFVANSYVTVGNATFLSDIPDIYSIIPIYKSASGLSYVLRDCLDFRVKSTTLNSTGMLYPAHRTELEFTANIYLPRTDYIWVDKNGVFDVSPGIPSENPQLPNIPSNALAIGMIASKAYVNSLKDESIVTLIENPRYTMSDIDRINTRLKNVEEVVSLNLLEQSAVNMMILDENGMNRYKSGIFTDNFETFNNSDFTNDEYDCTIDSAEQSIRCQFEAQNLDLSYNSVASLNTKKNDITITLPYTVSTFAENKYASEYMNIQKLLFYTWNGSLKLSPSIDTWVNNLGNIIVKQTFVETPRPPSQFRSWSTRYNVTNHRGENWGFGKNIGKSVVTTYTETTSFTDAGFALSGSSSISKESIDEYMRSRTVNYTATGLRPGVTLKATLDGKPLVLSNAIPASDGTLSGTFVIPAGVPVGTKLVLFEDTNKTSVGSAYYTARGKTIWNEVSQTYIRQWKASTTTTSVVAEYAWDPLAQSFFVEEENGVYIDSIDIFFQSKDTSIPVDIFVVECVNGYPSDNMLEFSQVQKQPSEVNIGVNVPTNFKFSEPLFLEGNKEYAFVVITPSYKYNIYTSTLGKADIITGIGIAEQPVLGSLFSSQNARTWTAEQLSDIKFKINKCVFSTSVNSETVFDLPLQAEEYEVAMETLVTNIFTPTKTSAKFYYKWSSDATWTEYDNRSDIFNTTLKTIFASGSGNPTPFSIKIIMSTEDINVSPQIDTEQVYGIFVKNLVKDSSDPIYIYNAGTYVSNNLVLANPANDIRVILDMITPGFSDADIFFRTTDYQPIYVTQATVGLGIDISAGPKLDGQTCQVFYYNNVSKNLEPKSQVIVTGYDADTRKIFLRSVGNPDEFAAIQNGDLTQTLYDGISTDYTAILILPISSSVNINCPAWTATNYASGAYVTYLGYIWRARTSAISLNTPSDLSIVWEKIHSLKTVSSLLLDDTIIWRKMKRNSINNNIDTQNSFVEYSYYPEIDVDTEFKSFSIKIDLKSRNKVDVPRVKNLRAIATV